MKLKFFLDKNNKKIYTLKDKTPNSNEKTKDAHYKFVRIKTSAEKIN